MKLTQILSPKNFYNFFNQIKSIRTSMMIVFSLLISISLLIYLLISLNYTQEAIVQNSTEYTDQLVKQVNSDIDSYIQYMKNISLMLTYNSDVSRYLFTDSDDPAEERQYHDAIEEQFRTLSKARPDICNIGIYRSSDKYM